MSSILAISTKCMGEKKSCNLELIIFPLKTLAACERDCIGRLLVYMKSFFFFPSFCNLRILEVPSSLSCSMIPSLLCFSLEQS